MMRDTVHVLVNEGGKEEEITKAIEEIVNAVQQYVPGYRMTSAPIFEGQQISVFLEVEGAGDFFPPYSGNLDIMTAAAVQVGNQMAKLQHGTVKSN